MLFRIQPATALGFAAAILAGGVAPARAGVAEEPAGRPRLLKIIRSFLGNEDTTLERRASRNACRGS